MTPARLGWILALLLSLLVALPQGARLLRAAGLLLRFGAGDAAPALASWSARPVQVTAGELQTPRGPVRARLYRPADDPEAPCMVLLHGIHRLGVEEPRLQRFARAVAAAGVAVYTPEVRELTEYRIEATSVETIGAAVREMSRVGGRGQVAVVGFSFAGGLALMTAADPRFREQIAFTVSVGGHHDLERVARFFVEDRIGTVEGGVLERKAHDYGLLVLLHGAPGEFFAEGDVAASREALRLWLAGDREAARKAAEPLSPEGRRKMELIFAERGSALAGEVRAALDRQKERMAEVSPGRRVHEVTGGVYLLHGADDSVVPPTEALWLARSVPPSKLRAVLVSPALQHAELQGKPSWLEQLRVVGFMAAMLDEVAQEPRAVR